MSTNPQSKANGNGNGKAKANGDDNNNTNGSSHTNGKHTHATHHPTPNTQRTTLASPSPAASPSDDADSDIEASPDPTPAPLSPAPTPLPVTATAPQTMHGTGTQKRYEYDVTLTHTQRHDTGATPSNSHTPRQQQQVEHTYQTPAWYHPTSTDPSSFLSPHSLALLAAEAHTLAAEKVSARVGVDQRVGLDEDEAARRRRYMGPNRLESPTISLLHVLREEITEPLILLLLVVAVLYALWGALEEAISAAIIVTITITLELLTEWRAKRALSVLAASSFHPPVTVMRGGLFKRIPKEDVVVGDVMECVAGERLVADGRLISSTWLMVDESALSGESIGVPKQAEVELPVDAAMTERSNMVYSGSLVLHGCGRVLVTATAQHTYVGYLQQQSSKARHHQQLHGRGRSPLQLLLKRLAMRLTIAAAVCCFVVMSIAFMRGLAYQTVVLVGLSLAFATIPEELPLLIKAVLAVGAMQLSRKGVLVKSLRTAESLAGVSVVLSDKTGTFTRNELCVLRLAMCGKVLRVPRPPPLFASAAGAAPTQPFRASTDDMLVFLPLIEQGWMMSSPSLITNLTANRAQRGSAGATMTASGAFLTPSPSPSPSASNPLQASTSHANRILDHSFNASLVLDPFDAAFIRLFSQQRRHPKDLNSVFLKKLFADSFSVAEASELLHVIPYTAERRRSACIRRLTGGNSAEAGSLRLCVRGAAEFVLAACTYALHSNESIIELDDEAREELQQTIKSMSVAGMRVMAFAVRALTQEDLTRAEMKSMRPSHTRSSSAASATSSTVPSPTIHPRSSPTPHPSSHHRSISSSVVSSSPYMRLEKHLTLLGFIGFGDVLRDGVPDTVKQLQQAGVEVKMVSGDSEQTCAAVGRSIGIIKAPTQSSTNGRLASFNHFSRQHHSINVHPPSSAADIPSTNDESSGIMVTREKHHRERSRSRSATRDQTIVVTASIDGVFSGANVKRRHKPPVTPAAATTNLPSALPSPPTVSPAPAAYDLTATVYARMTPDDKYGLVLAHRDQGHNVLVTGDGLNDAIALSSADVGLAMGSSGTDLARECAGIILTRDDWRGVLWAIMQGRRTLDNLATAIRFYLACKLALVILFFIPLCIGIDLPLSPLHIILLECLMDLGASVTFTYEPPSNDLMNRSPKEWQRDRYMAARNFIGAIVGGGMLLLMGVGGVLLLAHSMEVEALATGGDISSTHDDVLVDGRLGHAFAGVDLSEASVDETATTPSSEAAPSAHSSNSYLSSPLPHFQRDSHLQLTQSLVLVSWIFSTVLLANLMRNGGRSILFACCDRHTVQTLRRRRRQRKSMDEHDEESTAMLSRDASRPSSVYHSFSTVGDEEAGSLTTSVTSALVPTNVERRSHLDRREGEERWRETLAETEQSDADDEEDVETMHSSTGIEGLSQRHSKSERQSRSALLGGVCPLLSNWVMVAWMLLCIGFALLAVCSDWLRRSLRLAPLDSLVSLPVVFGSSFTFPAYPVAILPPLFIFTLAEVGKCIRSSTCRDKNTTSI